ncbi:MAG TPA: hypothetical protein PK230_05935, partial [Chitinophagales bacterium]|nr:hypothetical protein [Chitinophagales bacterium]
MKHILTVFSMVFLLLGGGTIKAQVSGTVFRDFNSNGTKDNGATYNEVGLGDITITAHNASEASVVTATNDTYANARISRVMRSMLNGYSAFDGINTSIYASTDITADCPTVTNNGECSNNTLVNSTLENGNFTPTGTFVGSPYMLIDNNGSSISDWWVNKAKWVNVQNAGGGPDGSCSIVWVDPSYGNSVCLYPIPQINMTNNQCYTMSVWAASFDPNNPTAAQTMSFDIVTNAGNEQYIVIDNNGGGTVNSFVDGPYGVVQVVTTLEANSNPLDMNGNPFTDANSQTLDWSTLNWQLVTITFHTTQDITITPNYSINGNSSNGVAFDNPVFGSCCAITCPDPRTDEIICKGIPPTGGFTYVLTTTLTGGNWTVSPTFPSIYIDQDPLDPTYLTTASGLPGGNTYTFTYNDGTCQDVITLTISDQSYTCASG